MILKFLGVSIFGLAVFLYLLAINSSQDLLFYLISNNMVYAFARMIAAGILLILIFGYPDFRRRHKTNFIYLGSMMIVFGIIGIMTNIGVYTLYNIFKPMDFLMFILAGVVIALMGMELPAAATQPVKYQATALIKPKPIKQTRVIKRPVTPLTNLNWE